MNKVHLTLAALTVAGTLSLATTAPASADGAASTRNIFLGAAALAGLAIESNVAHKNAQSHAVSGYLPDGSAVYGDGHVLTRNGYSYYPGNNGQRVACSNGSCSIAYVNQNGNGYPNNGYNGYPNNGYNGYPNNGYNGYPNNGYNGYQNNGYNGYPNNGYSENSADENGRGRVPHRNGDDH